MDMDDGKGNDIPTGSGEILEEVNYDLIQAPQFVDFDLLVIDNGMVKSPHEESPESFFDKVKFKEQKPKLEREVEEGEIFSSDEELLEDEDKENRSLGLDLEFEFRNLRIQDEVINAEPEPELVNVENLEDPQDKVITDDGSEVNGNVMGPLVPESEEMPNSIFKKHVVEQPECQIIQNIEIKAHQTCPRPIQGILVAKPKKLEGIKVTIPKPFNFHSSRQRPLPLPQSVVQKSDPFTFRARPAPMKVLHGVPMGLPEKIELKKTVPIAPEFASDKRIRERQIKASANHNASMVKENGEPGTSGFGTLARSRSTTSLRCSTPRSRRSCSPAVRVEAKVSTVIQPFSFDEREREKKRLKRERQQHKEEEATAHHTFHANPFPVLKPGLPKKLPIHVTTAEPFQLKVEERGAIRQEAFKRKLEEEERLRKEQMTFHANPTPLIMKEPFEPEASQKPITQPFDIELNSDRRAEERKNYDKLIKEREIHEQQRHREEEAERLAAEEKDFLELRKKLVHKAQPMKVLRAFEVKQSSKALTQPMSPSFKPLPSQRRNLHQIHNNVPEQ